MHVRTVGLDVLFFGIECLFPLSSLCFVVLGGQCVC